MSAHWEKPKMYADEKVRDIGNVYARGSQDTYTDKHFRNNIAFEEFRLFSLLPMLATPQGLANIYHGSASFCSDGIIPKNGAIQSALDFEG